MKNTVSKIFSEARDLLLPFLAPMRLAFITETIRLHRGETTAADRYSFKLGRRLVTWAHSNNFHPCFLPYFLPSHLPLRRSASSQYTNLLCFVHHFKVTRR